jgi:type II secretory pathway component GspD/PulD (secretin)
MELAAVGDKDQFTAGLNKLGAEGWELIAIESPLAYLFKRPAALSAASNRGQRGGGPAANRGQRWPAGRGSDAPAAPAVAALEIKVFRLKFAPALEAEKVLSKVLLVGGGGEGLRLASDPRTNSVVAHGPAARLQEVEALLMRLDTPDERKPPAEK